jgi:hypothetical protein
MEQITVKEKKYKTIEDGLREVKKYKTIDGQLFDHESLARDHENWYIRNTIEAKVNALPHVSPEIEEDPYCWYYAVDEEALDNIKIYFGVGRDDVKYSCEFKVGDWYGRHTDYGGDYPDVHHIVSLTEKKQELENYINSFSR